LGINGKSRGELRQPVLWLWLKRSSRHGTLSRGMTRGPWGISPGLQWQQLAVGSHIFLNAVCAHIQTIWKQAKKKIISKSLMP